MTFLKNVWQGYRDDVNRLHTAFSDQSVGHKQSTFQKGLNYAFAEAAGIPFAIVDAATGHSSDKWEQQMKQKQQTANGKSRPPNKVEKKLSKQQIRDKMPRKKFGPVLPPGFKRKKKYGPALPPGFKKKKKTRKASAVRLRQSGRPPRMAGRVIGSGRGMKGPFNPPATIYMQDIECSPNIQILPGRSPGSIILNIRRRIGTVIHATNLTNYAGTAFTSSGPCIVFDSSVEAGQTAANSRDTCMPISPLLGFYSIDPVYNLALNFNYFRCRKLVWDYSTDQTTNFAYRIYFAYTKDPDYMEKVGAGSAAGVSGIKWNLANIVSLPTSSSIVVWGNKTYRPPLDQSKNAWNVPNSLFSTTGPTGRYPFGLAGSTALNRQEYQGMMYIAGDFNGTTLADGVLLGELYQTAQWEMWDLSGTETVAQPTLAQSLTEMGVTMTSMSHVVPFKHGRHLRSRKAFVVNEEKEAKGLPQSEPVIEEEFEPEGNLVDPLAEKIRSLLLEREARDEAKKPEQDALKRVAIDDSPVLISSAPLPK